MFVCEATQLENNYSRVAASWNAGLPVCDPVMEQEPVNSARPGGQRRFRQIHRNWVCMRWINVPYVIENIDVMCNMTDMTIWNLTTAESRTIWPGLSDNVAVMSVKQINWADVASVSHSMNHEGWWSNLACSHIACRSHTSVKGMWGTQSYSTSLWLQTPTEGQTGLTCVWGRVIQTPAGLPGMSSAEGEVIPPVQHEVTEGGGWLVLLITANVFNTETATVFKHHHLRKLNPQPLNNYYSLALVMD